MLTDQLQLMFIEANQNPRL